MKIILATLPTLYSIYFLNVYLRRDKGSVNTVLVSTKPVVIDKRKITGIADTVFLLNRFGLRYFLFLAANQSLMAKIHQQSKAFESVHDNLWSLDKLAYHFGFDVITSNNFNSEACIRELSSINPDLVVVNGCDQILKKPFLNAVNKTVNIHPSFLPDDRGVDPIFQKYLRQAHEVSVSLHEITEAIDEGPVLIQDFHSAQKHDSYLQSSMAHGRMASTLLKQYLQNPTEAKSQRAEIQFPYKSWPTTDDLKIFNKKGLKLITKQAQQELLSFSV